MGSKIRHPLRGLRFAGLVALLLVGSMSLSDARSEPASARRRPEPVARPELGNHRAPGLNALDTWYQIPEAWAARGASTCTYDNGAPLDDFSPVASQWSTDPAAPEWKFIAGAADDFVLDAAAPNGEYCRLTQVRASFYFFQDGSESATPKTTWEGVYVTIYPNSASNEPDGAPTDTGGQTGNYIASRFVPASSLTNETPVGSCLPSYQIDIPVNIIVEKNKTYWLSLVPKHPAPPQSAWCLSQNENATTLGSQQGFIHPDVPDFPFWTPVSGNVEFCPGSPPTGTRKDLAFTVFGEDAPVVTGACCTDSGSTCKPVSEVDCQRPDQRFAANQTCAPDPFTPPCGTNDPGACCLPDGVCEDLTAADCANQGGEWSATLCAGPLCPPENGQCANAILLSGNTATFNTANAVTDGPNPGGPACPVNQDVWFRVIATCTGSMTASLCAGTNYDSAIAVYQGWGCGLATGALIGCDNDTCGPGGPSQSTFPVTNGGQYLIRVGGSGSATGTGTLHVECSTIPANDTCPNAIVISNGYYPFDTRGATTNPPQDNPPPPCANINQDIWLRYTARCTGTVFVSTCGTADFDTVIEVRQGWSCGGAIGPRVACDNDACEPGGGSQVSFAATLGAQYLIRLGGAGGASGTGMLFVTCVPTGFGACCHGGGACDLTDAAGCAVGCDLFTPDMPCELTTCPAPENDSCANALLITNMMTPLNTCGATTDGPADPLDPPCATIERDVWYSVQAPCTGQLTVSLCTGTGFDAAVAVYDGCACPTTFGQQLGCDNDGCGPGAGPTVSVSVTQSQCYLIRVGGVGGAVGTGELTMICTDQVTADCCPGDANGDMAITEADIDLFVLNVLFPPPPDVVTFCRTDANEDGIVDSLDITAFLDKLLLAKGCCCKGDMNGDELLDALDIQGLIRAVLVTPAPGTLNHCRADVNQDDFIDLLDVDAFINRLMADEVCPPP